MSLGNWEGLDIVMNSSQENCLINNHRVQLIYFNCHTCERWGGVFQAYSFYAVFENRRLSAIAERRFFVASLFVLGGKSMKKINSMGQLVIIFPLNTSQKN